MFVGTHGEVSEWSKVIDSKSIVPQGTEGSNPSLSASSNDKASRGLTARSFLCIKIA